MSTRKGMQGAVGVLLVQLCAVTSCVSAPEDGVAADLTQGSGGFGGPDDGGFPATGGGPSAGGSPSTGGIPAAGGQSAGGTPATGGADTGGTGGAAGCDYGYFYPEEGGCGNCQWPLTDFCTGNDCSMPSNLSCNEYGLPTVTIYRGCGYVRRVLRGDVGDWWAYTWFEETGDLVHFYSQPTTNYGCYPTTTAGVMPFCEEWLVSCETDPGTGGLGGGAP